MNSYCMHDIKLIFLHWIVIEYSFGFVLFSESCIVKVNNHPRSTSQNDKTAKSMFTNNCLFDFVEKGLVQ